jgi:23S rRNA pseudouridine1911/1915/1917 synthase
MTRLRVPPESAGERLDRFLSQLPEIGSRAVAERLLTGGGVRVDGRSRLKSHKLEGGEELEFEPPPPRTSTLEPQEMDLVIPYEDEHLLVVDKPAGLVVHPAPGHSRGTLVHGLLAYDVEGGDEPERPGIVHRLDRDTSGLLVVARSRRRTRPQSRAVESFTREYLALVVGGRARCAADRGTARARSP